MGIIVNIIIALVSIGAIAFGIFLVKSWLDFDAPIVSITYDPEKWEQEKRIIEGLDRTEDHRLHWENVWHNLSGTPIDQDAHNRYLRYRAYHSLLMGMYGEVHNLK